LKFGSAFAIGGISLSASNTLEATKYFIYQKTVDPDSTVFKAIR